MTATTLRPPSATTSSTSPALAADRLGTLGPIAANLGWLFIAAGTLTAFRAYPFKPFVTAIFGLIAAGMLLLTPAKPLRRLPVSMAALLLLAWIVAALEWTIDPTETAFGIRLEMPLFLGFFLVGGLLPLPKLVSALLAAVRVGIAMTLFAVVVFPWARQVDGPNNIEPLAGWRGFFVAKNAMAMFMVVGLVLLLVWEHRRAWRWASILGIAICIAGSRSATGISGVIVVAVLYQWLRHYTRLRGRGSASFIVTSAAVFSVTLTTAVLSVSSLTSLYGKDLTFSGRTGVWGVAWQAIQDRPFTGYGIRSVFTLPGNDFTRELWNEIGFNVPHSHSGFLDLGLQIGLVGVGLLALLYFGTFATAVRLFVDQQRVAAMVVLFLVVMVVFSLSESTFYGPWLALLLMMRALSMRRDLGEPDRSLALAR